jgi:hypothetical protein
METMRGDLEKKLRDLYLRSDTDVFGVIADEVIRQMEWARRRCSGVLSEPLPTTHHVTPFPPGSADIRGVRILGSKPLTLAPMDWKP